MAKSRNDPQDIQERAFFIDVDGTLERKILGIEVPLKGVVDGVRLLKREGALVFLWSTGGAKHARKAAREAGIEKARGWLPSQAARLRRRQARQQVEGLRALEAAQACESRR